MSNTWRRLARQVDAIAPQAVGLLRYSRVIEATLGLVWAAGGARGVYQAGVLKRIDEIEELLRGDYDEIGSTGTESRQPSTLR